MSGKQATSDYTSILKVIPSYIVLQDWTRVNRKPSVAWPPGRGYHAACAIPGPGLMIVGGEGSGFGDQTLGDAWVLDFNDGIWEQVWCMNS